VFHDALSRTRLPGRLCPCLAQEWRAFAVLEAVEQAMCRRRLSRRGGGERVPLSLRER
jgi:hypothetical protein